MAAELMEMTCCILAAKREILDFARPEEGCECGLQMGLDWWRCL